MKCFAVSATHAFSKYILKIVWITFLHLYRHHTPFFFNLPHLCLNFEFPFHQMPSARRVVWSRVLWWHEEFCIATSQGVGAYVSHPRLPTVLPAHCRRRIPEFPIFQLYGSSFSLALWPHQMVEIFHTH